MLPFSLFSPTRVSVCSVSDFSIRPEGSAAFRSQSLCLRCRAAIRGPSSLMKKVEPSEDQLLEGATEESSTSLAPTMLFLTTADAATPTTEESQILPVTSLRPQVQPRSDGDVMPTLDMALFDWTDYEDLKPEVWPSAKKKGTCCDLREHLCTPHNRGLNNKCFDDCMCMEDISGPEIKDRGQTNLRPWGCPQPRLQHHTTLCKKSKPPKDCGIRYKENKHPEKLAADGHLGE
ncbi:hypothetical protein STEG23_010114, partial [Scotinomys teguina]